MDPKRAKELVEELYQGIARRKAALKRGAGVVGVGVAVGLAGLAVGCEEDELPKGDAKDTAVVTDGDVVDEEVPMPVDLYGIMMDTSELPGAVDVYGVPVDAMDATETDVPAVDLYGVPVDAG